MLEFLKIFGASLGILAFIWKMWDVVWSYLYIEVDIAEGSINYQIIKTKVENRAKIPKKIYNAVLLVGPEEEGPIETYNKLMKIGKFDYKADCTDSIAKRRLDKLIDGNNGRIVMPLPFYYEENVRIGDEIISYCAPINTKNLQDGKPYSVRFFIWDAGRYHRSSHTSFIK